jgi:hypothetical protein
MGQNFMKLLPLLFTVSPHLQLFYSFPPYFVMISLSLSEWLHTPRCGDSNLTFFFNIFTITNCLYCFVSEG